MNRDIVSFSWNTETTLIRELKYPKEKKRFFFKNSEAHHINAVLRFMDHSKHRCEPSENDGFEASEAMLMVSSNDHFNLDNRNKMGKLGELSVNIHHIRRLTTV